MVELTEISAIVATAGVLVGIIYYIIQIRHQTKIRQTDLLIRLYSTCNSKEVMDPAWKVSRLQVKDYEDYVKQYGPLFSENPLHKALMKVLGIYDLVGSLLYKKLIDPDLAYNVVGIGYTKMLYESLKPIILGIRKETNEPEAYCGFDYLINELTRKEQQLKKTRALMLNDSKTT